VNFLLLLVRLDGILWKKAVCFAHQLALIILQKLSHVDRLINKELIYNQNNGI
jgi:hypothetical protein